MSRGRVVAWFAVFAAALVGVGLCALAWLKVLQGLTFVIGMVLVVWAFVASLVLRNSGRPSRRAKPSLLVRILSIAVPIGSLVLLAVGVYAQGIVGSILIVSGVVVLAAMFFASTWFGWNADRPTPADEPPVERID